MNDRFKFRMYDTNVNKMYMPNDFEEVESIYECIKQQINWDLDVDYDIKFNHLEDGRFFMQCTGLKDKNGKLIYEGDIVRYSEYDIEDIEPEWEYDEIIWGDKYSYPAFDFKNGNLFDCNGLSHIFNEGWTIEVIGNIYENKELLESEG